MPLRSRAAAAGAAERPAPLRGAVHGSVSGPPTAWLLRGRPAYMGGHGQDGQQRRPHAFADAHAARTPALTSLGT